MLPSIIARRLGEWRDLPWPRWLRWAVSPAAIALLLKLLYENWGAFHDLVKPYLDFALRWPWYLWVILGLVAFTFATLEASYRKSEACREILAERDSEIVRLNAMPLAAAAPGQIAAEPPLELLPDELRKRTGESSVGLLVRWKLLVAKVEGDGECLRFFGLVAKPAAGKFSSGKGIGNTVRVEIERTECLGLVRKDAVLIVEGPIIAVEGGLFAISATSHEILYFGKA